MNIKIRVVLIFILFSSCNKSSDLMNYIQKNDYNNTTNYLSGFSMKEKYKIINDIPYKQYCSPFALSLQKNNLNIIEFLFTNGGNVNLPDTNGYYPLFVAFTNENKETYKYLVERGANFYLAFNLYDNRISSYFNGKYFSIYIYLINELGYDYHTNSYLIDSINFNYTNFLDYMISNDAISMDTLLSLDEVNFYKLFALLSFNNKETFFYSMTRHYAVEGLQSDENKINTIYNIMLTNMPAPVLKSESFYTNNFYFLCAFKTMQPVYLFYDIYKDNILNPQENNLFGEILLYYLFKRFGTSESPLDLMYCGIKSNNIAFLIDKTASFDIERPEGWTILHWALYHKLDNELIKKIINKSKNLNRMTKEFSLAVIDSGYKFNGGIRPLDMAVIKGYDDSIIHLLINKGAKGNSNIYEIYNGPYDLSGTAH